MDNSSPVTFKSVRNIWMARDKPTGGKQRVGEPPQEFKAQKDAKAQQEQSESEQTQKGAAGSETKACKSQALQQLDMPKEELKGAETEVGDSRAADNQPQEERSGQDERSGENSQNSNNAAKEQHVATSPVSETAPSDALSLPEISESAYSSEDEDGDRSLSPPPSSPGSDGPIRRATDVFMQPDAGISAREDFSGVPVGAEQAQESGKSSASDKQEGELEKVEKVEKVEEVEKTEKAEKAESPANAPTSRDPASSVKPELIWADDLENAKPASRKSTGSPPPVEKTVSDVERREDASPANKPLPPPRSSLVTTVEMSYHQHVVQGLHKRMAELTAELNTLKTESDIQKLVNLPPADSSKVLAEMQHQLVEKDKRMRTLERENGDYKRNQMIQAVELQELNDHCQGLEKQVATLQVQTFPTLPPLHSVRETFEEDEDANSVRMAKLANAALRSAEEEIAALKKGEHKRQQLEMLLEHAKLKIASLQKGATHRQSSSPSQVSQMWEETRRQSDGPAAEALQQQLHASRAEVSDLRSRISELQRKSDIAHAVAEEARALLKQTQAASSQQMAQQLSSGPIAAVLQETLSRASQTEPEFAPLFRKASEPNQAEQQHRDAIAALEKKLGGVAVEVGEVQGLAGQGLEVLRVMEECLAHVDPLVSVLGQRADLNSLLNQIATRTQTALAACGSELPAGSGSRTKADMSPGGSEPGKESESVTSRVKELERSERFLKEELEAASTALAKATAQNNASSIELGILRNQLEGVTNRSPAQGGQEALQAKVQQLEREKEQMIQCLDELNRRVPPENKAGEAESSSSSTDSEKVQSLMKEKHELESTIVELRHLKEAMQVESQEARLHVLHLQRDNGDLKIALEDARSKIAAGHEELVLRRKEINNLSKKLHAVSAALEAINAESVQSSLYSTRTSNDHGSPSSVTSEGPAPELAAAREEIKSLHEKMIEYKKQQEHSEAAIAASEQLRKDLSSLKEEVVALRKKRAEQEKLLEASNHPSEEMQQELSKTKEELASLKEKMAEMEKQMKLKQQKLAVLAEYKMQMAKQNGELIKDA